MQGSVLVKWGLTKTAKYCIEFHSLQNGRYNVEMCQDNHIFQSKKSLTCLNHRLYLISVCLSVRFSLFFLCLLLCSWFKCLCVYRVNFENMHYNFSSLKTYNQCNVFLIFSLLFSSIVSCFKKDYLEYWWTAPYPVSVNINKMSWKESWYQRDVYGTGKSSVLHTNIPTPVFSTFTFCYIKSQSRMRPVCVSYNENKLKLF